MNVRFHALLLCAALSALLFVHGAARARDLDRSDPDRARIIEAIHHVEPAVKATGGSFVVLDLFKDQDAAFFCAVQSFNGAIEQAPDEVTGSGIGTYILAFALKKQADGWDVFGMPFDDSNYGHYPPSAADCRMKGRAIQNRADIDALIKQSGTKIPPPKDIDAADPDRARIIEVAHRAMPAEGNRFLVLDLIKNGDFAFFCAAILNSDHGSYSVERTDDNSDNFISVMKKQSGVWQPIPLYDGGHDNHVYTYIGGLGAYLPSAADCGIVIDGGQTPYRAEAKSAIERLGLLKALGK